jgi:hypothetical protein
MIPLLLLPSLILQAPQAPLPLLEAKDLPAAPRGPLPPQTPDLGAERSALGAARQAARRGTGIPALQLPTGSIRVKDKVPDISGWRAYAVEAGPGETVKVSVVAGRKAWFRVLAVNAWGRLEKGLLQNKIPTGEPMATYINPTREPRTIYFIVDTTDVGMVGDAFEVEVARSPNKS